MKPRPSFQTYREYLPASTLLLGCAIAWLSWSLLTENRHNELHSQLERESVALSSIIKNDIQKRLPDLQRIVLRWKTRGGTPQEEFVADVENYINDTPGYQAIEWVDPEFFVRWIVPLAGNEKALNLNLGFEERRRNSLNMAKNSKSISVSKPINLVQGGKGFLVYFPIFVDGNFDGFILAVFKVQDWLSSQLSDWSQAEDFYVSVMMGGDIIFETDDYNQIADDDWIRTSTIDLLGTEVNVSLKPKTHFYTHGSPITIPLIIAIILIFSVILSLLLFYLLKASAIRKQLQIANGILEIESNERKKAEQIANDANEAKSKFLAAMSHEIRTPLNAILGILQLVDKPDLPKDVLSKLKIAKQSAFLLMTLVNQVLDFARIESGATEKVSEEFVVSDLIAELYEMFLPEAQKKDLEFDYKIVGDGDQKVFGDFGHIRQILFNLIGNAIKFTQDGSVKILISILNSEEGKLSLTFEVSDTGYGISEGEQKSIFEEFIQSEAGRKSGMGTGLGLSISKQLSDLMGGELSVESVFDHGTTFTFSVLVSAGEKRSAKIDPNDEYVKIRPMNILVAEDNNVNQMIICEMLEQDGHHVVLAGNGAEAVNAVRISPVKFNLVLMDIQMPVMNGVDATCAIREIYPDPKTLPIVALTANAFKSQVDHYTSVGMQETLTKPVIRRDLRMLLVRINSQGETKPSIQIEEVKSQEVVEEYLDLVVLIPLTELMPREQFNLLVDSVTLTLARALPELMLSELSRERTLEISHEIKGMTANVGLIKLSALAAEIEKLAKAGEDTTSHRMKAGGVSDESLNQLTAFLDNKKIKI